MLLKMDIFVKFCIKLRNVKNIKYDKNVKSYNNKRSKKRIYINECISAKK